MHGSLCCITGVILNSSLTDCMIVSYLLCLFKNTKNCYIVAVNNEIIAYALAFLSTTAIIM